MLHEKHNNYFLLVGEVLKLFLGDDIPSLISNANILNKRLCEKTLAQFLLINKEVLKRQLTI